MKVKHILTIGLVITTLGLQWGLAQSFSVSGTVTDAETGEPLAGTQVLVKGTFVGTTTNLEGFFQLNVPAEGVTLLFTYIGYKTLEVDVSTATKALKVQLEPDVLKQEEVVVTGLASSVKRRNLANAVATISGDELVSVPTQTLDNALSGKFAGISVRRNTGAPGGGISVNLRGVSTIEGATQPLYIVDGVIVNNDANQSGIDVVSRATGAGSSRPQGQPTNRIGDINPNDIENIEVLKGASAAALYGAKASNGVIIIKTKRGRGGKVKVNFTQKVGQQTLLKKMGHRVFETYQEAADQYGEDIAKLGLDANGNWAGRNIDYEEELYGRTGKLYETTISAGGGNERTQFYLSGQYMNEGGIIINTGYKKLSGRVNVDHHFSEKVKLSVAANLIRSESDRGITGNDNTNYTYGFSIGFTPSFIDIRPDANGNYPDHPMNPSNPLETAAKLINNEVTDRALGSITLDYNLFRKKNQSFNLNVIAGGDYYTQENLVFGPPDIQIEKNNSQPGQSVMTMTSNLNTNLYINLAHKLKTAGMNFTTTAGLQYETQDWNSLFVHSTGMIPTQTNVDQAGAAQAYQNRLKRQDRGFFVQEEVALGENVNLAFGFRGDRSSTIGNTKDYQIYPKASGSYQLGSLANVFDDFKIRAAWGQTGNQPVPGAKYRSMNPSNIGGRGGVISANLLGNPDIKPERSSELEYGIDFSFLKGLGMVEFTMFNQNIDDLLLEVDQAASSGATSRWENAGAMKTWGTELSVTVYPIRSKKLNWLSRMNYYKTRSEITRLDVDPFNMGGFATFLGTYRIQEGVSPTSIVGSESFDENGKFIKPIADETPDYQVSLFNSINVGNFDFSFLLDIKQGGYVINLANLIYDLGGTTADYEENGPTRLGLLGTKTAPYIEDGSYKKLREVNLTYTLPAEKVRNLFAESIAYLKIGISGRNLWQQTDYTGLDPEVSQFGNVAIGSSVDTAPFPSSKSLYFHIAVGI